MFQFSSNLQRYRDVTSWLRGSAAENVILRSLLVGFDKNWPEAFDDGMENVSKHDLVAEAAPLPRFIESMALIMYAIN